MKRSRLKAQGISRQFGRTKAIDGADLEVSSGVIHALVGENGAGKSTLVRILTGLDRPDSGTIEIEGRLFEHLTPRTAMAAGVYIVPQERIALDELSVPDNILSSAEASGRRFGSRRRRLEACNEASHALGITIPLAREFSSLSNLEQALAGLLRASAAGARLIVLDEPTAYLATHEATEYLEVVRRMRDRGVAIIYISHFLEEVLEVADEVTILRDGTVVQQGAASKYTVSSLVQAMVGSAAPAALPRTSPECVSAQAPMLEVLVPEWFHPLTVASGEIVGLSGLMGSGRTSSALRLIGVLKPSGMEAKVSGKTFRVKSPAEALRRGVAYLPEDRKKAGIFHDLSLTDNSGISRLSTGRGRGGVRPRLEKVRARAAMERVGVKFSNPSQFIGELSGGNQQKLLLGRLLEVRPQVLIVDEPTRGVDVSSKQAIYDLLRKLAESGMAIVVISSEIEEVMDVSHRAYVMRSGRITHQFETALATAEQIVGAAFGAGGEEEES